MYLEWPDHGVLKDTFVVREILKRIYHVPPNIGLIAVRCRLSSRLSKCVMMMLKNILYTFV